MEFKEKNNNIFYYPLDEVMEQVDKVLELEMKPRVEVEEDDPLSELRKIAEENAKKRSSKPTLARAFEIEQRLLKEGAFDKDPLLRGVKPDYRARKIANEAIRSNVDISYLDNSYFENGNFGNSRNTIEELNTMREANSSVTKQLGIGDGRGFVLASIIIICLIVCIFIFCSGKKIKFIDMDKDEKV